MKRILLATTLTCLVTMLSAQTNVKLKINHIQTGQTLAPNQTGTTANSESYNIKRCEYYISEIELEHDGGLITSIDSSWILVNGFINKTFDLGQFNVTSLEAVRFSIGVDPSVNHADPTQWPNGHALAPKSPSMHWGWSAGYRFFALEGKCGSSVNFTYELHSLGDPYYYDQRIETAGSDDNGDLLITLNADIDKSLSGLSLGTGIIDHGDFPNNIKFLQNVRDFVFKSSEGTGNTYSNFVGIDATSKNNDFAVYPNPSSNGSINLYSSSDASDGSNVKIVDQVGRVVYNSPLHNGLNSINLQESGMFILSVEKDGNIFYRERLVVNN